MAIKINMLGIVEVFDGENDVTPSAPKIRRVLAMLALRCGRVVPAHMIIEELWGENPPKSATTTLQTYIYQLRRSVFGPDDAEAADSLVTRSPGYQLNLEPCNIDFWQFKRQLQQARELIDLGRRAEAITVLSGALGLWRGKALADVQCGQLLEGQATALDDAWLSAVELKIDTELQLGTHANIIGELRELVTSYPLNENLHALLILALNKSNRRAEALVVYQQARARLRDELGSEPSAVLRAAQAAVLGCAGPPDRAGSSAKAPVGAGVRPPAQLPPDTPDFTGRAAELAELDRFLATPRSPDHCHALAVTGPVGIGKSSLVVHAAHRNKHLFPDGQLFAEMQGLDGERASMLDVLGGFLRALGHPFTDLPHSVAARSSMFRSEMASRSMLVVLDQVEDPSQVRSLLPAQGHNAVLLTSRRPIRGLPGSHEVGLDVLPTVDAVSMFWAMACLDRPADGSAAAAAGNRVAQLCGRLPLAIRAAAERFNLWDHLSLDEFAARLAQRHDRLEELRSADVDLTARIDCAYRSMDRTSRHIFALLSLTDRGTFSEGEIRRMVQIDDDVESTLGELIESRLVECHPQPDGATSYELPELVRLFAFDRLAGAEHHPLEADRAAS